MKAKLIEIRLIILLLTVSLNLSCHLFGALPANVKRFMETADMIEIIADADKKSGKIVYRGDMIKNRSLIAAIEDEPAKKQIIESIGGDVGGSGDAVCFNPNHIIKATKGNEVVEMEVCYQCLRYKIKGALGEFSGGLNSKSSENVLNKVLFEKRIEVK